MRRIIARTLWLALAGTVAVSGCNSNSDKVADQTELKGNVDKNVPSGAVSKADRVGISADEAMAPMPSTVAPSRPMKKARRKPGAVHKARSIGQYSMKKRVASGTGGMVMAKPMPRPPKDRGPTAGNTEDYKNYGVNPMVDTTKDKLSTFAIDVDTASYAIARRKILSGQIPAAAAVRVEEFVNYFRYDYAGPTDKTPFAVHMDAAPSPFTKGRHILRVGVQAKKLSLRERKNANLVFLVDVSGSMHSPDKLDLAKRALRIMVNNLKDGDTVSLVTYAGNTRVVLAPTGLDQKSKIFGAIEDLSAGGSTAMSSGLKLAYEQAAKGLKPNTISRVMVLSDGDANVGRTNHQAILKTIRGHVKEGVTLSTVGFGMGNYKDTLMEQLANKGNGNYYYIDSFNQAKRVFQEQLGGTLEVVAKDVKIQVEFDPKVVKSYRLVGYENRDIADKDFRNDKVDAGEIGAGHTVTAVYELELAKKQGALSKQQLTKLATVRVRAKKPRGSKATEHTYQFDGSKLAASFSEASADFRFATAVAATAEILRRSPHARTWKLATIERIAKGASKADSAERQEFIKLLDVLAPMRSKIAVR